ncbi:MAG: TAXI family TRAP transporter solute-binding subunit [Geminicoccales bacterium]
MSLTLRTCVMLSIVGYPFSAQADQHKLAASSINSTYHSAGVALEAVTSIYLMPETGIRLTSISTEGVHENLELLSLGEVDFAIIPSLLGFHAKTGTGSVATLGPRRELRAIAMLVPTYFQAFLRTSAVSSGRFDDLFDLGDQKLQLGLGASEAAGVARFLFRQLGADTGRIDDMLSDKTEAVSAFRTGEIDALITTGNLPTDQVVNLIEEAGDKITILSITDEQLDQADKGFGLLKPATIPAETYPLQTNPIETAVLPVFLATRADVDDEVVYQVAKIMFEQVGFLRTIHPAMAALDFESSTDDLPFPLHPGAARYYRDFGLAIDEAVTAVPEFPVFTLDASDAEQRRIDTNTNVVGIMVDPDLTSLKAASDLAVVVNSAPGDLRVVVQRGEGSPQTINDLLYLKGVDLGIVQADVLDYLRREEGNEWLSRQLHYLARLYESEVHVLAGNDIKTLKDLTGKPVNFGRPGSTSEITAANLFSLLGMAVEQKSDPVEVALEKLQRGEIAAVVLSGGKPLPALTSLQSTDGLKLLDVPLIGHPPIYGEASLTSGDYPNLLNEGQEVRTLSIPNILLTYRWPRTSDRYQLLAAFYATLKDRLDDLQLVGRFHPKWQDVSLTGPFVNWTRSPIVTDVASDAAAGSRDAIADLPTPAALPLPPLNGSETPALEPAPSN